MNVLPLTVVVARLVRIVMHRYGQVNFNTEVIHREHCWVIDLRSLWVLEHCCQIVVPAHNFTYSTPHPWVLVVHPPNVTDGVHVARIERHKHGRESGTVNIIKGEPSI